MQLLHWSALQVRAIISADKVVVFKSHNERDNRNIIAPMLQVAGGEGAGGLAGQGEQGRVAWPGRERQAGARGA